MYLFCPKENWIAAAATWFCISKCQFVKTQHRKANIEITNQKTELTPHVVHTYTFAFVYLQHNRDMK